MCIDGTLDWKQPIADFQFLSELPNLEVLAFGQVVNKSPYPALLPSIHLTNLKRIRVAPNMFAANEYALMEVGFTGVEDAAWEPCRRWAYSQLPLPANDRRAGLSDDAIRANHPEVFIRYDGQRFINDPDSEWFEFVGKGAGRVKCTNPAAAERCAEYAAEYSRMKEEAKALLRQNRVR